ncbi:hypothetical protein FIBSPDRAFT_873563 [Athelia psychrophila]|uniref:Uncharacterized protein n=1 Tax=Athelia psychrophila TaxID=1759441 RepID=A0A165YC52_9AGAM|nr:hypothetical protein FIBSPDRAFT_873563 [Fibularhizoctonia sp. CBS 109695]
MGLYATRRLARMPRIAAQLYCHYHPSAPLITAGYVLFTHITIKLPESHQTEFCHLELTLFCTIPKIPHCSSLDSASAEFQMSSGGTTRSNCATPDLPLRDTMTSTRCL